MLLETKIFWKSVCGNLNEEWGKQYDKGEKAI
jgi:hypothetical protein